MDTLSLIERPNFDVSVQSVREHFKQFFLKRKSKNREEEGASGISPEPSESVALLDELIAVLDAATIYQQAEAKEAKEKLAADLQKAEEMRRQSMETLRESRKRKLSVSKQVQEKKRDTGEKTFEIIQ